MLAAHTHAETKNPAGESGCAPRRGKVRVGAVGSQWHAGRKTPATDRPPDRGNPGGRTKQTRAARRERWAFRASRARQKTIRAETSVQKPKPPS